MRLIDADEFLKRAIGTKCFGEDDSRILEQLVGESITIVPAERSEMSRLIDASELLEHLEACLQNGRPLSNLYDLSEIVHYVKSMPTASPWHRVEEPPKKTGKYAACWIYQEKIYWDWLIFIDGNWVLQSGLPLPDSGLPLPDYWMPIEPPKEDT